MYVEILYYFTILCLLIPFSDEDAGNILLGLAVVMISVELAIVNSQVSMYLSATLGEIVNLWLYSKLGSDNKVAILASLSVIAVFINLAVYSDPYQNIFYTYYTDLNKVLVEITLVVLTFKSVKFFSKR